MKKTMPLLLGGTVLLLLLGAMVVPELLPSSGFDSPIPDKVDLSQLSGVQLGTNPETSNTLVQFGDFSCPWTKEQLPAIQQLLGKYPQINYVFKHFPSPTHPDANIKAEAAECAREQGAFFAFHNKLLSMDIQGTNSNMIKLAEDLGLDSPSFISCMQEGRGRKKVQEDKRDALFYSVRGTPTIFINGRKLEGLHDYDKLEGLFKYVVTMDHETS